MVTPQKGINIVCFTNVSFMQPTRIFCFCSLGSRRRERENTMQRILFQVTRFV